MTDRKGPPGPAVEPVSAKTGADAKAAPHTASASVSASASSSASAAGAGADARVRAGVSGFAVFDAWRRSVDPRRTRPLQWSVMPWVYTLDEIDHVLPRSGCNFFHRHDTCRANAPANYMAAYGAAVPLVSAAFRLYSACPACFSPKPGANASATTTAALSPQSKGATTTHVDASAAVSAAASAWADADVDGASEWADLPPLAILPNPLSGPVRPGALVHEYTHDVPVGASYDLWLTYGYAAATARHCFAARHNGGGSSVAAVDAQQPLVMDEPMVWVSDRRQLNGTYHYAAYCPGADRVFDDTTRDWRLERSAKEALSEAKADAAADTTPRPIPVRIRIPLLAAAAQRRQLCRRCAPQRDPMPRCALPLSVVTDAAGVVGGVTDSGSPLSTAAAAMGLRHRNAHTLFKTL